MTVRLPEPRPIPAAPPLRWGVMAPGGIAEQWVSSLHAFTEQRAVAVGSRSRDRADRFAARHGITRSYGSYEGVATDPEVDAVYIASPHHVHAPLARLAIAEDKHVLIEKPFATSAPEAALIVEDARRAGVLAMEAMWTRYLPQFDVVRHLLADHAVGDIDLVAADFGFQWPFDPTSRMYDPALAGGALLDAGIYPISFVSSVLGAPAEVIARGALVPTGVEFKASVLTTYAGSSAHGIATTSTLAAYPVTASISGTEGRIDVPSPFLAASGVRFTPGGWGRAATTLSWTDRTHPQVYDSMHYEADAFAAYVDERRTESPIHTLDETVSILAVIDEVRRQLGVSGRP